MLSVDSGPSFRVFNGGIARGLYFYCPQGVLLGQLPHSSSNLRIFQATDTHIATNRGLFNTQTFRYDIRFIGMNTNTSGSIIGNVVAVGSNMINFYTLLD